MKRLYIVLGALVAGVAIAAFVVLQGGRSGPREEVRQAPDAPAPDAAAAMSQADPNATGVIVIASQGVWAGYTPAGKMVSSKSLTPSQTQGRSADGRWLAIMACTANQGCRLFVDAVSGTLASQEVSLPAELRDAAWSPAGAQLVIRDAHDGLFVYDPAAKRLSPVSSATAMFSWSGDRLVYMTPDEGGTSFWAYDGKTSKRLASTTAPVARFYASPSGSSLAFVCPAHDGWTLSTLDVASGALTDFGHLRAIEEKGTLAQEAPAIAIAWSPDESQIAVSPVSEPYVLHLLASDGSGQRRYFFDEGYAGELVWSPRNDGMLAVSTYSPDRSRHEVYVLDTTGDEQPRHLLDGCHIEWAPDGRYMAVKREPRKAPGVSAIRVSDGANWPVAAYTGYIPLSWGVDEADAVAQAGRPINAAAVLAK